MVRTNQLGWAALGVALLAAMSARGAESQEKVTPLAKWSFDAGEEKAWRVETPGAVEIAVAPAPRPEATADNKCLLLTVRQAGAKLTVVGPELKLTACSQYVTRRLLNTRLKIRAEGLADGAVQIRFRKSAGKGSNWVITTRPHRDWDRLIDMPPAHKWRDWVDERNAGKLDAATIGLTPVILIDAEPAEVGGKLYIDDWELFESAVTNHLIKILAGDHILPAEQGAAEVEFADAAQLAAGAVVVRDEMDRELERVPAAAGLAKVELREPGFYQLTAEGDYADGRRIVTATTAVVAGPPLPEELRSKSVYGIGRCHGTVDTMVKLGGNWEYGIGRWQNAEQKPDGSVVTPGWKRGDPRIKTAWAGGGKLPDWLTGNPDGDGLRPPKDWDACEKLFESWARDSADLPDVVAAFNESDAHWRGSFDDFVRFHQAFVKGVKRGRPSAVVASPNMYSIRMDDFKKYDRAGMFAGIDAVMMHAYVNATPPEGEFIDRVEQLIAYLAETGRGQLPIYLTEFGWTGKPGDWQKEVDELTKARYLARSLILLGTKPQIGGLCYFVLRYAGEGGPGYGIMDIDNYPLPGAAAFATLTRQLTATAGQGHWLRLSPSRHLCAFPAGTETLAAVWDMNGEGRQDLPAVPVGGVDMTGRPLSLSEANAPVSPSPAYVRLPGTELLGLKADAAWELLPGDERELAAERVILAPPLAWAGNRLTVPADAPLGQYGVIYQRSGEWRFQPLTLQPPLAIESQDFGWNGGTEAQLKVKLSTRSPAGAHVRLTGELAGAGKSEAELDLPAGGSGEAQLSFAGLQPGQRYRGTLKAALLRPVAWQVEQALDATFVACARLDQEPDAATWEKLPPLDFSAWEPKPEPLPAEDCSARVQLAASPAGFHLRVAVTDDQHRQEPLWSFMWKEDSIQVAFDVDADKEWQPNNVGFGFNGHRIFEWGFALAPQARDKVQAWRFRAEAPNRKGGPEFDLRPQIVRDEAAKLTRYEVLIPWSVLDLKEQPAAGARLGFALAVNDGDPGRPRRMLQLFTGIVSQRDPINFGKLWLLPAGN